MTSHAIIVIGAAEGGVNALMTLAEAMPPDLNAALFVVISTRTSLAKLPHLLSGCGQLPAVYATDGRPIEPGMIYIAPGDHHLLVGQGCMHVTLGPKEHGYRPAVDPLFRSAAATYGPRVVGVVLSGMLDDGTAGLMTVKHHGGVAIVQDRDEAIAPAMPHNALAYVAVDHIVPVTWMGSLLGSLATAMAQ